MTQPRPRIIDEKEVAFAIEQGLRCQSVLQIEHAIMRSNNKLLFLIKNKEFEVTIKHTTTLINGKSKEVSDG